MTQETKNSMTLVLNEYARCGVIGIACDRSGVPRTLHYQWLKEYPKYAELFETIKERFVDGLEAIAIERAKEKSDGLLTLMLKSHRPQVYGDRSELNVKGDKQGGIQLVFAAGMLTAEEKKLLGSPEEDKEEED